MSSPKFFLAPCEDETFFSNNKLWETTTRDPNELPENSTVAQMQIFKDENKKKNQGINPSACCLC
jgi:hypothetical protein